MGSLCVSNQKDEGLRDLGLGLFAKDEDLLASGRCFDFDEVASLAEVSLYLRVGGIKDLEALCLRDWVIKLGKKVLRRKLVEEEDEPVQPLSTLTHRFAMCGFTEVLTWILCSYKDITSMLNKKDNNSTSVKISNPRSADFEVSRTTLMPGLLKTVRENNHHPKPIKIFEVGDVVLLNKKNDVGARNRHHLAALFCDDHSGFEVIHGLVQRIMEVMDIPCDSDSGYCIKDSDEVEGEFLPGSKGSIIHEGEPVGSFGIVHPEVLGNFKISFPCSYMEIDLQCFFN